MLLQSKQKTICLRRLTLTLILLTTASVVASAQTNTFPASGNAGVGTTSPTADLEVKNSSHVGVTVNSGTGSTDASILFQRSGVNKWFLQSRNSGAPTDSFVIYDAVNYTFPFVLTRSGNVGIGTTAPNQALAVGGWNQSAYGFTAQFYSGNTTTPTNQLNITDTKDTWGLIFGSNGAGVAQTGYHGPSWAHVINVKNAPLSLGANNTAVLNLTSSGNPAPHCGTALLNNSNAWGGSVAYYPLLGSTGCPGGVQGLIMLSAPHIPYSPGGAGAFTRMADSVAATNYWDVGLLGDQYMIRRNSGSAFVTVTNGGNVGIGTTPAAGYKLDVAGEIRSSSGGFRFPDGTVQTTAATGGGGGSQWTPGTSSIHYNGGSVGIGTSTPSSLLNLHVTSGDVIQRLSNAGGIGGALDLRYRHESSQHRIGFTDGGGNWLFYTQYADPNTSATAYFPGNVTVNGTINAKYQDLAEWVPSSEQLAAGTVVVLDTNKSNQVIASGTAYDTRVAGVISAQPGITLGEGGEGKVLVATSGRVRVKVDASRGAIQIGDLLVTSDAAGVAMKSQAVNLGGVQIHRPGTIIGKALEPLAKGKGEILVLLSLQ
ncbi:MAG TPA: hypothetical protein VFX97_03925 [Pyrinomonadaceae bacterium]|nr:hypothetical protein [Pyrinomonadaceae bacterium]